MSIKSISSRTAGMQFVFWAFVLAGFIGLISLFSPILMPFVLGLVIAYLLNPLVRRMSEKGIKRWVSALLILGAFFLFVSAVIGVSVPLMVRQGAEFFSNAPYYSEKIMGYAETLLLEVQQKTGYDVLITIREAVADNAGKTLQLSQKLMGGLAAGVFAGGSVILGFLTTLLLVPIVAYFMMKDWPYIVIYTKSLMPQAYKGTIEGLLAEIDVKISSFIRGQLSVCFLLGVMYALALSVAGLQYGALIGLMTGVLSVIPYVGTAIGLISSVGVALLQSDADFAYTGIILTIFAAGQFIEGNFLTPKLIGESVGLHPLWVIFALMAGGSLLGILGMVIAIPLAAVISVLAGFACEQYKQSDFYKAAPLNLPK